MRIVQQVDHLNKSPECPKAVQLSFDIQDTFRTANKRLQLSDLFSFQPALSSLLLSAFSSITRKLVKQTVSYSGSILLQTILYTFSPSLSPLKGAWRERTRKKREKDKKFSLGNKGRYENQLLDMASPHYRSQFGDTTYTKVFVGGLAWETPTEEMRRYFEQFGDILEAVIITDKNTGRSKGYGFVTYRDPESARRACLDPNPVIDGRRANCNIASLGRPRPSPPRGRNHAGIPYQGGAPQAATSYSGRLVPPPPPPPPPLLYPPYGYATYAPEYGYPQTVYNPQMPPQYYQQLYGTSSSGIASPYHYAHVAGYSFPASSGTSFSASQSHRVSATPILHYPPPPLSPGEAGVTTPPHHPYTFPPHPHPPPRQPLLLHDLHTFQLPAAARPSAATTATTTATGAAAAASANAAASGSSDTSERGAS